MGVFLFFIASFAGRGSLALTITRAGWKEIGHREFNVSENITGLAVINTTALLCGNTKIINRNQHLNISDKLNDGKQA